MIANWVKENISAGGTGNLTLSGAVSGYIKFSDAFATSQPLWYCIEDGTSREIGEGHLSASTTLVRDKVHETLVSGTLDRTTPTAINASTSATVSVAAASQSLLGGHPGWSWDNGTDGMCSMGYVSEAQAGVNITRDYLHFFPFWWASSKEVSQASLYVSTAGAAGSVLRCGIYSIATNGKPGQLLKEFTDAAAIDSSTTGNKVATPTATIWLPSGFYYMCLLSGSATGPAVRAPQYSPTGMWLGSNGGSGTYSLIRTYTYAALPSDESSQTHTAAAYAATVWLK